MYNDTDIRYGFTSTTFTKSQRTRLKACKPTLLEYHLRLSTKQPVCDCVTEYNYHYKTETERLYGPRWILTTYAEDAFVNFIQVDIDRHSEDDSRAKEQVELLEQASEEMGFEIVWTTSPGSLQKDGSVRHGIYAWIRLDADHFVFDIRDAVLAFLSSIGLADIVQHREGAYLKRKKLVRLPGQYNVELACPNTFEKLFNHSPIEANKAFQEAWVNAEPLASEILFQSQPQTPQRDLHTYTHCSVPPTPLSPSADTFTTLLRMGRTIVNQVYPDDSKRMDCISELIQTAEQQLPSTSKTRQNNNILTAKARQVVNYLWDHTDVNIKIRAEIG